jgi:DUF2075 family protein
MGALIGLLAVGAFVVALWLLAVLAELRHKAKEFDRLKPKLDTLDNFAAQLSSAEQILKENQAAFEVHKQDWRTAFDTMVAQKCQGFPWLADAFADFLHLEDLKTADYLSQKWHPAPKAAAEVRSIAQKRRKAEKLLRVYRYLVDYYETLFPWLEEFKGEDVDQLIAQIENPEEGDEPGPEEEPTDPARRFLTEEEYARLSPGEKFQLALDRYWRKKKTSWEVGRDYERYVGYLFESQRFKVYYQGIVEGLNDLGRDLVCDDGNQVCVVQCKKWSEDKTIHEKHVFQLFGSVTAFKIDNPSRDVKGMFVTSTGLSPRARQFAQQLGITVTENLPLPMYPCVKCNVSRKTGERIYHLPFDQQYDRTIVEADRHEFYVSTVVEAEARGFRRAFRWRGEKGDAPS